MKFFDAHTHAHFAAFKDDYRDAIRRALDAGVGLVNVGTQKDTSRRAGEVAHEFENDGVYAAVGLHPIHTSVSFHDVQELEPVSNSRELENRDMKGFTSRGEEFDYDYYKKLALDPKTVAIGECGLDYFHIEAYSHLADLYKGIFPGKAYSLAIDVLAQFPLAEWPGVVRLIEMRRRARATTDAISEQVEP